MKNYFTKMIAVALTIFTTMGFAACSSDDDDDDSAVSVTEAQLIGTWESVLSESYVIYNGQRYSAAELEWDGGNDRAQFKADHTYCTYYWNSRSQSWVIEPSDNGVWSLNGNIITITFDKDGYVSTAPITEFSASRMVIKQTEDDEEGGVINVYNVFKKIN